MNGPDKSQDKNAPQQGPWTSITLEKSNGVARLSLNRPERLNVLNSSTLREFNDAISAIEVDEEIRTIILRSNCAKAFTAGADITEMRRLSPQAARSFSALGHLIARRIEVDLPPTIAALNGYVMGGGVEIASACDFRVASEDVVIAQPEIDIGIFPGWGGSQRLARIIGFPRAKDLILTGRKVAADEALRLGLVHNVVPVGNLDSAVTELAEVIALKSRSALIAAKRAVNLTQETTLGTGLEQEIQMWALMFDTPDQKEGMNAFLEKRKPRFL